MTLPSYAMNQSSFPEMYERGSQALSSGPGLIDSRRSRVVTR
jgi:hypothetical protein